MHLLTVQWNNHPKFKGVYLKHLIKGDETDGQLSCHMVKVDPGCVLESHIHENEWELDEIIEGEGVGVGGPLSSRGHGRDSEGRLA